jgi:hypothetical protein
VSGYMRSASPGAGRRWAALAKSSEIVHVRCFLGMFPHILVAVGRACLQGRVCVNKRKGKRSEALYYLVLSDRISPLSRHLLVTRDSSVAWSQDNSRLAASFSPGERCVAAHRLA